MKIPDWWSAILLALAAWRCFQLLARDDILDVPRRKILRLGDWKKEGDRIPSSYRTKWGLFLTCPYCAGFWIALAWWGAWQISTKWALVAAVPFALSAAVVAADKVLSSE